MSKKKIALFLLAAAIAVIGALVLNMRWNNRTRTSGEPAPAGVSELDGEAETTDDGQNDAEAQSGVDDESDDEQDGESSADGESEPENDEQDEEEKVVNEFDDFSDKWNDPSGKEVTMADIDEFKRRFLRVPGHRKGECLQRSLNLLPDDHVMLLAGILLDKSMDKEYLDMVFNDVLNRDEDVKKPILAELYKDKEHPCWADTAWIFDATGETPDGQQGQETEEPAEEAQ
ncbi:MAG: hypothetical protein E7049_09840 [Lentisphaerae bacterium]|jgi:hypothetical protein|nr:hypothetical protein [Lentisphaerota bacterium]